MLLFQKLFLCQSILNNSLTTSDTISPTFFSNAREDKVESISPLIIDLTSVFLSSSSIIRLNVGLSIISLFIILMINSLKKLKILSFQKDLRGFVLLFYNLLFCACICSLSSKSLFCNRVVFQLTKASLNLPIVLVLVSVNCKAFVHI